MMYMYVSNVIHNQTLSACALSSILKKLSLLTTSRMYELKGIIKEYFACRLIVLPYLSETPQTKYRLTGENVTLCCEAIANPQIEYFEW